MFWFHFKVKPWVNINHPLCAPGPQSAFLVPLFSFQPCILCLPVSLPLTHMFYFYFSSISPISSFILLVFPFSGLLVTFPVLCDCPCQMLPITVRNMPSISPLILKRLKVPSSLPPTTNLWMPTAATVIKSRPSFSVTLLKLIYWLLQLELTLHVKFSL